MTEQREITWTQGGLRHRGRLVEFMPLHDDDQFIILFAIVETRAGYIEIIDVKFAELRFVCTADGVEYGQ